MNAAATELSLSRIMPALVHMQAHLAEDLSLDLLADEAKLSKFHFHELFCKLTGETPKDYVDRLRLERAALQLRIRQSRVLDIALECGYRNHETFTRAFRNRFGMSPRDFRRDWKNTTPSPSTIEVKPDAIILSPTRVTQLARMIVAFIRYHGSYETVAMTTLDRLSRWGEGRGIPPHQQLLMGIAHDAPGITAPDKVRFDCCLQVPCVFENNGEVACERTPGGLHAITDYSGSWDLESAYKTIFQRLKQDSAVEIIGLPAIEYYQADAWKNSNAAKLTIAIPVRMRTNGSC